jgi:hypothetical protein
MHTGGPASRLPVTVCQRPRPSTTGRAAETTWEGTLAGGWPRRNRGAQRVGTGVTRRTGSTGGEPGRAGRSRPAPPASACPCLVPRRRRLPPPSLAVASTVTRLAAYLPSSWASRARGHMPGSTLSASMQLPVRQVDSAGCSGLFAGPAMRVGPIRRCSRPPGGRSARYPRIRSLLSGSAAFAVSGAADGSFSPIRFGASASGAP